MLDCVKTLNQSQPFKQIKVACGEGAFFGSGPAFELAFALFGLAAAGERFDVDDALGWVGFGEAGAALLVFGPAAQQVVGAADLEPVILAFEDVDVGDDLFAFLLSLRLALLAQDWLAGHGRLPVPD